VRTSRRTGERSFISYTELRQLHQLHVGVERLSMRELARRTYKRFGYSSAGSCVRAIHDGWRALGLKTRGRVEMIREMQATDGLFPRDREERRRRCHAAGLTLHGTPLRPPCRGLTKRGTHCQQASTKSGYCWIHDPERLERAA